MIAPIEKTTRQDNAPEWHNRLLQMLPTIVRNARHAFKDLSAEIRQDAIAEVIANCTVAVARLAQRNMLDLAYLSPSSEFIWPIWGDRFGDHATRLRHTNSLDGDTGPLSVAGETSATICDSRDQRIHEYRLRRPRSLASVGWSALRRQGSGVGFARVCSRSCSRQTATRTAVPARVSRPVPLSCPRSC